MTREAYNAIEAVNFSTLKWLLRSPAHYQAALQSLKDEEEEKYLVGKLAHAMVLENKDLRDMYAIKPKGMSFASKEGKAWRDAQTLPVLKEEDSNRIPCMAEEIANHPDASRMLKECSSREYCIQLEMDGINFKALLDGASTGSVGFIDIKTTTDARPREFAKKVNNLHYDMQVELYGRLLALDTDYHEPPWFAWIVCESAPPFAVVCSTPVGRMIDSGAAKLDKAIALYKKCKEADRWPAYETGIHDLDLPEWSAREFAVAL